MPFPDAEVDAAVMAALGDEDGFLYTPFGGSQVSILGFFQEPDEEPATGEIEFLTTGPMVSVLKTDVPTPTQQDLVTRVSNSQNYQVKDFTVDEGEWVTLELEETT